MLYQNIIDTIVSNSNVDIPLINDLIETGDEIDSTGNNTIENTDELYTDIYFPKVYNDEQIQIIDRLSTRNKVLVQGPPGTGKSHTIANLISHLLAHGKTILITAHTKRALTVLKNHLPDEVKPLCVNLLGNDTQSVNDLESSVVNIIQKFDVTSEQEYKRKITELGNLLIQEKKQQKQLYEKLLNIKEIDSRKQTLNDFYQGSLLDIAKKVNDDSENYSWFEDEIQDYEKTAKYISLLESVVNQHLLYKSIEKEFDYVLYNGNLMELDVLKLLKLSESDLLEYKDNHTEIIDGEIQNRIHVFTKNELDEVEKFITELLEIKKAFDSCKLRWSKKASEDCIEGYSGYWIEIFETTSQILSKKLRDRVEFFEKSHKIEYSKNRSKQQINADTNIFISHLESGKSIRKYKIFNNKEIKERWYLTTDIFVNGSICDTLEEYKLLKEHIEIELEIDNLEKIWNDKIDKQGSNYLKFLEIEKNRDLSKKWTMPVMPAS